mmetsp:Transcript_15033/g.19768  ORF Transcript_15033/g.19768 Transcript_15033/m.19768 type:complete len:140 (+) Transcript_15033:134-553(+)|eukprot:CAMPEP_0195250500 /NCGR_PEP_ID=MMETSP0706-20130129/2733_1 /TAXON_ID=33640 /ORGANISM="Asterionellopsis glacialis, Strain CCMP134" /LENGTH=139 /DNA_ID=CAMNT_0040302475 /DNA_START=49 /DNA_END=468 /DNA_ORIENTATION=+
MRSFWLLPFLFGISCAFVPASKTNTVRVQRTDVAAALSPRDSRRTGAAALFGVIVAAPAVAVAAPAVTEVVTASSNFEFPHVSLNLVSLMLGYGMMANLMITSMGTPDVDVCPLIQENQATLDTLEEVSQVVEETLKSI